MPLGKEKQPKNKVAFVISSIIILIIIIGALYLIYYGIMHLKTSSVDKEFKETAQVQAKEIILELQANESTEKKSGPIAENDVVQTHVIAIYGDNVDKKTSDVRLIINDDSNIPTDLKKQLIGKNIGDTIVYEQNVLGKNYETITSHIKINAIYKLQPINNKMVSDYVKKAGANISDKELLKQLNKVKTPEQLLKFLEDYIYKNLKNQDQALT